MTPCLGCIFLQGLKSNMSSDGYNMKWTALPRRALMFKKVWIILSLVLLSACHPPIRDFEDVSSFEDHVIDNSIKNILPKLSPLENLYELRIREALLRRFPIGTDTSEVIDYLTRAGSQCTQRAVDSSEEIGCHYEKAWPFERYRMGKPLYLWRDEKIEEGHFVAKVLITLSSNNGILSGVKVIADRERVTTK